ncbi:MAG: hypothetical protein P4L41_07330 [Flavipsychrobacter sp.]|nr:hypothetical protein [Flavipsychrobacter sp.]
MKFKLLLLVLLTCVNAYAQDVKIIKLKNQSIEYMPRNFHIANVTDDRENTTTIGAVHIDHTGKLVNINLQGGAASALQAFIEQNVKQNNNTTAINIHLKQLKVYQKNGTGASQVVVEIGVGYYIQDQLLIEYSGNASQQGGLDISQATESLVRKNINETLTRFDEWWASHKNQYNTSGKMVATGIKMTVEEGTTNGNDDLILYSTRRSLTLDDFKGLPDDQNPGAVAVTYSGINVSYNSQIQDGRATVKVVVTPTFSISKSWCRTANRNAHTLNHEQKHFDLTGLKACELITAIKNYPFSPEHYEQELDALREKALKELDNEQNLYDRQTNHGTIPAEQARWTNDINKRVAEQNCY